VARVQCARRAELPIDDLAQPINSRKWEAPYGAHGASTDTRNRSRSMGTCTQTADFQTHIPSSSESCGATSRAGDGGGGGDDGGFERSRSPGRGSLREQLSRVVQEELPVLSKEVRVPVALLEQQGAELVVERSRAKNTR
jgi:hypothetical protein